MVHSSCGIMPHFASALGLRASRSACSICDSRDRGKTLCVENQVTLGKCLYRGRGSVASAAHRPPAASAQDGDDFSYLSMWKKAKERYDEEQLRLQRQNAPIAEECLTREQEIQMRREREFARIMEVPEEERNRAHRKQVIDRAAAALAAAEALLASRPRTPTSANERKWEEAASRGWESNSKRGRRSVVASAEPAATVVHSPGPDFWAWSPPPKGSEITSDAQSPRPQAKAVTSVLEQERDADMMLDIPFESGNEKSTLPLVFQSSAMPSLPPLQSLMEVKETVGTPTVEPMKEAVPERGNLAAAVVHEEKKNKKNFETGVNPDGSRWWKETGEEDRGNGVTCNWTVTRGVSSQGVVEWEEKFWEACDDCDYKELGAEKSGRDAAGNVWREFWKETMWQDTKTGLLHIEKSAEKWGKNGKGDQWSEKWWERYDASGRAEKWADKWSQIDPHTQLDAGHAHVWHERWGEEFDGKGSAIKWSDKWAERSENGGWTKWGDKWDERYDKHAVGRKQGETWWEGASGERWNRTWGEEHKGTGVVHKYGQSSSGEHWDTHEQQDTWYERHPHYGFHHCYDNSQELRKVTKKKRRL